MKKFLVLVLFLFSTVQASQIPVRGAYEFRSKPELMPSPKTLTEAVRWGTLEEVKMFLSCGWNPNASDKNGRTSMHFVIFRQDNHAIFILQELLFAGGSLTVLDKNEATPVHEALTLGNKKALKIFIVSYGLVFDSLLTKKYPVIDKVAVELGFPPSQATVQECSASGSFSKTIARPSPF